jgi:hypothetical protein
MKDVFRWGRSIGGDVEMTSELSSLFVCVAGLLHANNPAGFRTKNSAPCQKDSFSKVTQSFVQSAESRRERKVSEDGMAGEGDACKMCWGNLLETGHLENRGD